MVRNVDLWLPNYLRRLWQIRKGWFPRKQELAQVLFTICDHYEPFWNKVNASTALQRVTTWRDKYQPIAAKHVDCLGAHPKHCFFYPEEEYQRELLEMVSEICRNGFGEVEIHLHHDNDTADNLRHTLLDFKNRLQQEHGLLAKNKNTSEVQYGFIHGNWALDNSRPDGRWCGVNNEIDVLLETGCYADFTMPSAPHNTQTSTVNSLYYAVDDPDQPKSHDTGVLAHAGRRETEGLLCVQGPLALNMKSRKFGVLPRIENGCLAHDAQATVDRVKLWIEQRVHVEQRPDVVFIKLHTHGTQEKIMDYFFEQGGMSFLFSQLESHCNLAGHHLYYVSARQMYNVIKGLENNSAAQPADLLESELVLTY